MSSISDLTDGSIFGGPYVLLWIAGGLAALFLGLLFYDGFRRKLRRRKHWNREANSDTSFRKKLQQPVEAARMVRNALSDYSRRRARQQELAERRSKF